MPNGSSLCKYEDRDNVITYLILHHEEFSYSFLKGIVDYHFDKHIADKDFTTSSFGCFLRNLLHFFPKECFRENLIYKKEDLSNILNFIIFDRYDFGDLTQELDRFNQLLYPNEKKSSSRYYTYRGQGSMQVRCKGCSEFCISMHSTYTVERVGQNGSYKTTYSSKAAPNALSVTFQKMICLGHSTSCNTLSISTSQQLINKKLECLKKEIHELEEARDMLGDYKDNGENV